MVSFKGMLKYLAYLFIGGWMFLLGIMVGRGTSPVTFDTQGFQKRLETIAREFNDQKGEPERIDLKFYDVLDHPVPEEGPATEAKPLEIIPKKEVMAAPGGIPLKESRKRLTFNKQGNRGLTEDNRPDAVTPKEITPKEIKPAESNAQWVAEKSPRAPEVPDAKAAGEYTIQIAAYKAFKDAVTQMAILEKKGFASYRVKGQKDGVTWYRVRTGSFATYEAAKQFKEKLNKANIKALIIKEDRHEDIKG